MARSLFCECGAVYDADKLAEDRLYKCRECGAVLSSEYAVEEELLAIRQEAAIPKTGMLITAILIVGLAIIGFALAKMNVVEKVRTDSEKQEKTVSEFGPKLDQWETSASRIRVEDKSEQRASELMGEVFDRISQARDKVYPAVVMIECGDNEGSGGTGSGAIFMPDGHEGVDTEGYIVTNFHVVQNAFILEVMLSNQETSAADLIYADPFCDVAVIKLKYPEKCKDIKPAKFADSEKVRIGDFCMAMGAPQGLGRSVSIGVVTAQHRMHASQLGPQISHREHCFIQMDAPINHGNSGGPTVNLNGEIIGMNTLGFDMYGFEKFAYCISSNYEREIANTIVRNNSQSRTPLVERSTYGLEFLPMSTIGRAESDGVIVSYVADSSPAYQMGLRPGDIITRAVIGGKEYLPKVHYPEQAYQAFYAFQFIPLGTGADVTWHNYVTGEEKTGSMSSAGFAAENFDKAGSSDWFLGTVMTPCTTADLEGAGFEAEEASGFVIQDWADSGSSVIGGMHLRDFGLKRGDIIRTIDGVIPQAARHIYGLIVSHFQGRPDPIVFEVIRGKAKIYFQFEVQ
ncbi:MAG: trypsin-like peptidase domain-containing protein [Candidatus Brocadiia bacterium]